MKSVCKFEDQVHGGLYDTPADALTAERINAAESKKLVVDCCEHCPWHDLGYDGEKESHFPICWNDFNGIMPKPIEDAKSIPDWCTLEDN